MSSEYIILNVSKGFDNSYLLEISKKFPMIIFIDNNITIFNEQSFVKSLKKYSEQSLEYLTFEHPLNTLSWLFSMGSRGKVAEGFPLVWFPNNHTKKHFLITFDEQCESDVVMKSFKRFTKDDILQKKIECAFQYVIDNCAKNHFFMNSFGLCSLEYHKEPIFSDSRLKIIGAGNLALALQRYFKKSVVYGRTFSEKFDIKRFVKKSVYELSHDDFLEGDTVIYTVASSMRHTFNKSYKNEDMKLCEHVARLVKDRKIRFFFISSIATFNETTDMTLYSNLQDKNPYGLTKIAIEDMLFNTILNKYLFIIRPSVIQYYETVKDDNVSTLCNLALNTKSFSVKFSEESLKNSFTYPLKIFELLNTFEYLLNNQSQDDSIYLLQGNSKKTYYEILNEYHGNVSYGTDNGIVSKSYSKGVHGQYRNKNIKKNILVILAGGHSERFCGDVPKQFFQFNSGKLVEIVFDEFSKDFDETVVLINDEYRNLEVNIPKGCIQYVKTKHRLETIRAFVENNHYRDFDRIVIKDANCPILDRKLLYHCLAMSDDVVLGVHCLESSEGILKIDGDSSEEIDRKKLYETAIKCYSYGILKECAKISTEKYASELGYCMIHKKPVFINSQMRTFKLTYQEDLEYIHQIKLL